MSYCTHNCNQGRDCKCTDKQPLHSMSAGMRESFEFYFSDKGTSPKAITRSGDGYLLMQTQSAWAIWQARQPEIDALQKQVAVQSNQINLLIESIQEIGISAEVLNAEVKIGGAQALFFKKDILYSILELKKKVTDLKESLQICLKEIKTIHNLNTTNWSAMDKAEERSK